MSVSDKLGFALGAAVRINGIERLGQHLRGGIRIRLGEGRAHVVLELDDRFLEVRIWFRGVIVALRQDRNGQHERKQRES
jgi:hypothetical protein